MTNVHNTAQLRTCVFGVPQFLAIGSKSTGFIMNCSKLERVIVTDIIQRLNNYTWTDCRAYLVHDLGLDEKILSLKWEHLIKC